MTAAITLFFVLTISILMTRLGSVALRQTGLSPQVARFQALSAFTGTGFTTSEADSIVNHPLRRRIVALLMIIGNLGLVTVLATVIITFLGTRESMTASFEQALWLGAVLVILWFLVLNRHADRIICHLMGRLLRRSALFDSSQMVTLLQLPEAHAVAQIRIDKHSPHLGRPCRDFSEAGLKVLGITGGDGHFTHLPAADRQLNPLDKVILYGSDDDLRLVSEQRAHNSQPKDRQ